MVKITKAKCCGNCRYYQAEPQQPWEDGCPPDYVCIKHNKGTMEDDYCEEYKKISRCKRFTLIELLVLVTIVSVLIAMFVPACRSAAESRAIERDSEVRILKMTKVKGENRIFHYTRLEVRGHEYFIITGNRYYENTRPVHCTDCRKCKGETR